MVWSFSCCRITEHGVVASDVELHGQDSTVYKARKVFCLDSVRKTDMV